jgi:hypothetical protein
MLSHSQKVNRIGYGNFQTYGSLHWLIFWDRSGNISHIQNFYSLPPSHICLSKNYSTLPLSEVVTIFTDASGCGTVAYYTKDHHKVKHTVFASTQRAELYAVVMVLRDFPQQPINLYSDSHNVVGVLCYFETAYIDHTSSEELFNLFFVV